MQVRGRGVFLTTRGGGVVLMVLEGAHRAEGVPTQLEIGGV